jgi:hypothetical protein
VRLLDRNWASIEVSRPLVSVRVVTPRGARQSG